MTKKLQTLYKEMKKLEKEFNEIESKLYSLDDWSDWSDELENESDVAYERYYKSLEKCIFLIMKIVKCDYIVAKNMLKSEKMEKIMQYNII